MLKRYSNLPDVACIQKKIQSVMGKKPPDFKYRERKTKQVSWISVRECEIRNQCYCSVINFVVMWKLGLLFCCVLEKLLA